MQFQVNKYSVAVGSNVHKRRMQLGFSQKTLAAKAGMPTLRVCKIEVGHHTPTPRQLSELASALGVNVDELYPSMHVEKGVN